MMTRVVTIAAAVALVGIALTGCSRNEAAPLPAPVATTSDTGTSAGAAGSATPAAPAPAVSDIQSDLDSAGTSLSGAGNDLSAGEAAQATNDNN